MLCTKTFVYTETEQLSGEGQRFFLFSRALLKRKWRKRGRADVRAEADCSLMWKYFHNIGWGLSFQWWHKQANTCTLTSDQETDKHIKEETANDKEKKSDIHIYEPQQGENKTNLINLTTSLQAFTSPLLSNDHTGLFLNCHLCCMKCGDNCCPFNCHCFADAFGVFLSH